MPTFYKISRFFLLVSISTIFISNAEIFGPFRISLYSSIISCLFFLIAIFKKEISILKEREIINYSLLSIGALLIGTIASWVIFRHIPVFAVLNGYFHILLNFSLLVEIITISNYDKTFPRKILLGFLFSLLIIPFIYVPTINKYFLHALGRFEGLLNDPNYFASFQIIPSLLILFFIVKEKTDKDTLLKPISLFIIFCVSIGLILWSGSRGGILSLAVSLALLVILLIPKITKKMLALVVLLILISFPLGFWITPPQSRSAIKSRIHYAEATGAETNLTLLSNQDRLTIWKNSLYFIARNPLGYGIGYYTIIDIHGDGQDHRVSHNFDLELLLTGGILLFLIINIALYKIIIQTIKNCYTQKFSEVHILLAILGGLLVSSMLLDSFLSSRWIWVIVALMIVYNRQIAQTGLSHDLV
jgi:hypothetical protein